MCVQDAAGIVTAQGGRLFQCKDKGLVRDVFTLDRMKRQVGNMGVGHGMRACTRMNGYLR